MNRQAGACVRPMVACAIALLNAVADDALSGDLDAQRSLPAILVHFLAAEAKERQARREILFRTIDQNRTPTTSM